MRLREHAIRTPYQYHVLGEDRSPRNKMRLTPADAPYSRNAHYRPHCPRTRDPSTRMKNSHSKQEVLTFHVPADNPRYPTPLHSLSTRSRTLPGSGLGGPCTVPCRSNLYRYPWLFKAAMLQVGHRLTIHTPAGRRLRRFLSLSEDECRTW